jgi:hypothetical protein
MLMLMLMLMLMFGLHIGEAAATDTTATALKRNAAMERSVAFVGNATAQVLKQWLVTTVGNDTRKKFGGNASSSSR